jgi:hypothetical protein
MIDDKNFTFKIDISLDGLSQTQPLMANLLESAIS